MNIKSLQPTVLFRFALLFLFAFCVSIPAGSGPAWAAPKAQSGHETATVKNDPGYRYVIGPEDVLEISVWRNDDLSKVVTVRPDGVISLPLIGDVKAAGLTPDRLRESLVGKLKEFQETVVVSVVVLEVNSLKIFILGEVVKPGGYTLKRRTSVIQAIAMAGGFTQFASKNKIVLIREETIEGRGEEKIRIKFDDLVSIKTKQNKKYLLISGDTIFVP